MMEPLPLEPTIDCHAHVFAMDVPLASSAWTRPAHAAPADALRRTLDAFGIARAVLAASSLHDDGNQYLMNAAREDAAVRATVIVSPEVGPDRLGEFAAAGARGIRLQLRNKELPDLRSPAYRTLFRHLQAIGWHVELHDDSRRLEPMIEAIEESGVPLVVDHFGRPGPDGVADAGFRALIAAVGRGRTWVKISAAFRLEDPCQDRRLAEALLEARGPERLLWGSDWPFVGYEASMTYGRALADLARAVPDPAVRSAIDVSAVRFYFGARSRPER